MAVHEPEQAWTNYVLKGDDQEQGLDLGNRVERKGPTLALSGAVTECPHSKYW